MSLAGVGFAILLGINSREQPGVAYFALFLAVAGVSPVRFPCSVCSVKINPSMIFRRVFQTQSPGLVLMLDLLTRKRLLWELSSPSATVEE